MNKNNKFTITEYIEKIKFIYPNWSFDVIEFNGYKNNIELLEIKYNDLDKINLILNSKFNDYRKSNGEVE